MTAPCEHVATTLVWNDDGTRWIECVECGRVTQRPEPPGRCYSPIVVSPWVTQAGPIRITERLP